MTEIVQITVDSVVWHKCVYCVHGNDDGNSGSGGDGGGGSTSSNGMRVYRSRIMYIVSISVNWTYASKQSEKKDHKKCEIEKDSNCYLSTIFISWMYVVLMNHTWNGPIFCL